MDAVEFIVTRDRMCRSFNNRCRGCEIANRMDGNESCNDYIKRCPAEAVAIVEKWSKEHPRKTRQSELLKIFPNARRWDNFIDLCPQMIEKFDCPQKHGMDNWKSCAECKGQYWNEEVEDDD